MRNKRTLNLGLMLEGGKESSSKRAPWKAAFSGEEPSLHLNKIYLNKKVKELRKSSEKRSRIWGFC